MEKLKQAILEFGVVQKGELLQLDALLTHQVDPQLIMEMGREFARRFEGDHITRVVTIEASGIPIALATAYELGVPMVFARRKKTLITDEDSYCERVPSFAKGIVTDLVLSKRMVHATDRVLVIDDIIANGHAAGALMRILRQAGCQIAGFGVAVEKAFQPGGSMLRAEGIRIEALATIQSLEDGRIRFA